MRATGAGLLPIALLALLAALTFWLDRATQGEGNGRDGKHRHDPDYMADNFHVRRFAGDGALQHSLVAQKMLHYPDDDSTEVIAPRLTYHRTPPVRVSSNKAWLDRDGKHVKLDGDVRVIRDSIDDRPPTEIATSVAYAVPDDEFAHTDAPVTITQGQTVINGTGLETNNKTQMSVLFGRVRGIIYQKQAQ
ncbi:MAG: LPS export ABC transporter periplasmic protein LptC [Rhodocyclales bacterium GWA2_65_20]|nr:MAG: LPS export ABC transporter periplasmic protein LptC [Rhodocyclales bacterium GWA2_65_20]